MPKTGKYKVYYYYCEPTDMYYIGYTSMTLAERAGEYFEGYNRYMQADLYEYGYDAWECDILHYCDTKEEAKQLEIEEIEKHDSYRNGYNGTRGGEGGGSGAPKSKIWDHAVEICERYEKGETLGKIASDFVCSMMTIGSILRENSVSIRTQREVILGFDISKYEAEICERYENGESSIKISKRLGCSSVTILNVLRKNDIKTKSRKIREGANEICKRYESGESSKSIAKDFVCSSDVIRRILRENNIRIRTNSEAQLGFDISQHGKEICKRYESGESLASISKIFGCDVGVIRRILCKNSVKIRSSREATKLRHQKKRKLKLDSIDEKQQSFF